MREMEQVLQCKNLQKSTNRDERYTNPRSKITKKKEIKSEMKKNGNKKRQAW